jgi:hypothetical protein
VTRIKEAIIYWGALLTTSVVCVVVVTVFVYFRVSADNQSVGEQKMVIMEVLSLFFSTMLLTVTTYYRVLGRAHEVMSAKRTLGWRAQAFHLLTLGVFLYDLFC